MNSIEARQLSNGEFKLIVRTNLPYYQHLEFKRMVEETMEENGLPILKLVGASDE